MRVGMKLPKSPSKFSPNRVQNAARRLNEQAVACTWFVQELAAVLNGVGFARLSGRVIVWAPTGLVNVEKV